MIESIAASIIYGLIPPEWVPVVIIALTALIAFEQWLASTNRIKANSTLQLIMNIFIKITNKSHPNEPQMPLRGGHDDYTVKPVQPVTIDASDAPIQGKTEPSEVDKMTQAGE